MLLTKRTTKECQTILFNLGIEFGVPPGRISTLLLSDSDKSDMLAGVLSIDELRCHIVAWKASGMNDMVGRPKEEKESIPDNRGLSLIKPFITYAEASCLKDC